MESRLESRLGLQFLLRHNLSLSFECTVSVFTSKDMQSKQGFTVFFYEVLDNFSDVLQLVIGLCAYVKDGGDAGCDL